jgi:hypothetical protein
MSKGRQLTSVWFVRLNLTSHENCVGTHIVLYGTFTCWMRCYLWQRRMNSRIFYHPVSTPFSHLEIVCRSDFNEFANNAWDDASRLLLCHAVSIVQAVNDVVGFLFNTQPDALIIQNLFYHKTLHVSGIFSAHHKEFSTVHSALVSFMQVF